MKRTWLEIDLNNLKNNYEVVKSRAPGKEIMAIVKANAYGCGSLHVALALSKMGVNIFGVACISEAIVLRNGGISDEILILGATNRSDFKQAFDNGIQLTISRVSDLEYIENEEFLDPKVQLAIDTGMGRLGFLEDEFRLCMEKIHTFKNLTVTGVYSHFSSSEDEEDDPYTEMQIKKFLNYLEKYPYLQKLKYIHLENSSGLLRFDTKCLTNTVRPGVVLYGFIEEEKELKQICKLKSVISHLKILEEDSYISYNRTGFARAGTMIATIPIGYADGYNRRFSNRGIMYIHNIPCKVIGRVCMDMTMVEIPEILMSKVKIGDKVDVFGDTFHEQLRNAEVNTYEQLTGVSERVYKIIKR